MNLPNSLINAQKYPEDKREKLPKGNCAYMNKSYFYFTIKPVLPAGHWWKHGEVSLALSKHLDSVERTWEHRMKFLEAFYPSLPSEMKVSSGAVEIPTACLRNCTWNGRLQTVVLSWSSLLRSHNCPFTRGAGLKVSVSPMIHFFYFSTALNSSKLYFSHL